MPRQTDDANLFTSFAGRINRRSYWRGFICLVFFALFLGFINLFIIHLAGASFPNPESFLLRLFVLVTKLAAVLLLAPLMVKRLHDRDKSGWQAALPIGLLALNNMTDFVGLTGYSRSPGAFEIVLVVGGLIALVWYMFELGFLRGTRGPNRYGPDPLAGVNLNP